jgi:hypothetical protein
LCVGFDKKRSLGILRPLLIKPLFRRREIIRNGSITDSLFPDEGFALHENPQIPVIEVTNLDGTVNTLQLLEWGCSEFGRLP